MTDNEKLADLLFGSDILTPEECELRYPPRELPEGARVTRFSPSPTGYLHIGGLFGALVDFLTARVSGGLTYLRIEDTDKKREVADGVSAIINGFKNFGLEFDEGVTGFDTEKGAYGPYTQSKRVEIYHAVAKRLVQEGKAYPCFCTADELAAIREEQENGGAAITGYFGKWAKCRDLSFDEQKRRIEAGEPYVLRFRSEGDENKRIVFDDMIRGKIEMPENIIDEVLLKSDGVPTYHFAHVCDDHFMRTTHVIRGEEWISSVPKHIALFTQFIGNYAVWQKNGGMLGGTSPPFPSLSPLTCLKGVLWFPYNLYCMAGCAAAVAVIFLYRKLFSQDALTDSERNFDFSAKGTYGTSGWMQTREVPAVLDMVSDLSQHTGTVLGMLDGKFLCIPEKTRMNGNLAVYGASGSMKTRSFCMNRILQSAARGESLIICDPKSELYEKSSEYMRDLGYTVRVFNLVSPENSDSWNCLKEIEGQELMAQLFVDVIIKNTNGTGKSDRFWDSGEMNLLKALVLYVDLTYPPEQRNIGEVYNLITQCSESQLDSLFDVLPLTHPAKAPYSLYQRASDSVRSGVISGLGSRLQVFQSELIKKITAYDEISLELPGQQPCAYYLVTSDQDSTFDFLASLFLSFAFIKLVRYADANCPGGRLPVPVHVLGEELTACGTISELSRRISVIRSRNISMSCVFQNLAGLQNRYPQNQWQEILGNCDVQLFLGCTDQLTAEYVSQRTGIASVAVSSTSKALSTLRVSDYTPQYRESSGVGKRPVLTPDEVLRLPVDEALVILRGHKVLKVRKMDYSLHPAYKQLRECKASAHIPEWRKVLPETLEAPPAETAKASPKVPPRRRGRPAKSKAVVATDKESIITKPENEKEIPHGNEQ